MSKVYRALGLMSGTSLDGVDVAVIETDGEDIYRFSAESGLEFTTKARAGVTEAVKAAVHWAGSGPPPNSVIGATTLVDSLHIEALRDAPPELAWQQCDIIGYHGQTVYHRAATVEAHGLTLQLGDGQRLADETGLPVVFDFRSADVAAGGQGAPLAPIFHEALVRYAKLPGRVAVLNLGGVANVSAIDDGVLIWATDCGPANGPLDSFMQARTGRPFDEGGEAALRGEADHARIEAWLEHHFFRRAMPRSADRYDFAVENEVADMTVEDGAATLVAFAVQAVTRDLRGFEPDRVVICGGGAQNPAFRYLLRAHLQVAVQTADEVGWDSDFMEAQAFAYLAVRSLRGLPNSFPTTTGVPEPIVGGRIAYPRA